MVISRKWYAFTMLQYKVPQISLPAFIIKCSQYRWIANKYEQLVKNAGKDDIQTENIKLNSNGSIIEKGPLCFPPSEANTKAEYHFDTRGILNEIFWWIDPGHRTIGECLWQDISSPLNADAYIGIKFHELSKSVKISALSTGHVIRESMKSKIFGR